MVFDQKQADIFYESLVSLRGQTSLFTISFLMTFCVCLMVGQRYVSAYITHIQAYVQYYTYAHIPINGPPVLA